MNIGPRRAKNILIFCQLYNKLALGFTLIFLVCLITSHRNNGLLIIQQIFRTANPSTPACYLLDQALTRLLCFIISTTETPNVKVFHFLCKNSGPQQCHQSCLGHSALRISQTDFYLCVCACFGVADMHLRVKVRE